MTDALSNTPPDETGDVVSALARAATSAEPFPERPAVLHLTGWHGKSQHRITVLRETPKRYRVRFHEPLTIRGRLHPKGSEALVPKIAVTFPEASR